MQVLRVPCFKPAMPAALTTEDLHYLAPLKLALSQALVAQQIRWDAEALVVTFAPLLKFVGGIHGIRAHKVNLSLVVI